MNANPILLQKKYARVIQAFAELHGISYDCAFDYFYRSQTYLLMREGISDMHCRSDAYLAEELRMEYDAALISSVSSELPQSTASGSGCGPY